MRRLDASYKFTEPNLTTVEANDALGENGSQFEMNVKIVQPDAENGSELSVDRVAEGEA